MANIVAIEWAPAAWQTAALTSTSATDPWLLLRALSPALICAIASLLWRGSWRLRASATLACTWVL